MALKDSYLSLITSQHRNKPKFAATVSQLIQYSEDVFALAVYLDDEFDLDMAVGSQQDVLGTIIGLGRRVDFSLGPEHSSVLSNEEYRVLQKAKIIRNHWNGKIEDLYEKWLVLFGTPIFVKDNQDMTLDVLLDIDESIEMQALMKLVSKGLIIPKPMSVRINYKLQYPDIILPVPIHHRAEILQVVDAKHNIWNLGNIERACWDGEYPADGTIRGWGIRPEANYRERQQHTVTMQMYANPKQNTRWYNTADGSVVADGSHIANGSRMAGLVEHAITLTPVKNGTKNRPENI